MCSSDLMLCCGATVGKKLHQESLLKPVPESQFISMNNKSVNVDPKSANIGKYSMFSFFRNGSKAEALYYKDKEKFYKKISAEIHMKGTPELKDLRILFNKDPDKFRSIMLEYEPPITLKWECWLLLALDKKYSDLSGDQFQVLIRADNKEVDDIVSKDVPRTFSQKAFFKGEVDDVKVGREMLYKLCKAVGVYFKNIGYTQGFNFLAAFVLEVSEGKELECLNFLICMLKNERFLFIGAFDDNFPLIYFLNYLFHKKLAIEDPEVEKIIKSTGLPDEVWLHKWFMSMFTGYMPTYFCSRVFDIILATDIFSSVSIAVSLTKHFRKEFIKNKSDFTGIVGYISCLGDNYEVTSEINSIINKSKKLMLSKEFIDSSMDAFTASKHPSAHKFERYAKVFKKYLAGEKDISQISISVHDLSQKPTNQVTIKDEDDFADLRNMVSLMPPIAPGLLQSRLETIKEESPHPSYRHDSTIVLQSKISNLADVRVISKFTNTNPIANTDTILLNVNDELYLAESPKAKPMAAFHVHPNIFRPYESFSN